MSVYMKKLKKIIPLLALTLVSLMVAGALKPEGVLADNPPNNPHYFYGSVTTLAGENVPYDPEDPAQTTMVYARDMTRVLNFDGLDEYSSGEYFGRPVSMDAGVTVYGYDVPYFAFPAFDYDDPSVPGARPGDIIQFYICPPGRELPGVLVTDPETGLPVQVYYVLGGLNQNFGLSADVVPPAPEEVSPPVDAVDVLRDDPITILFDEEISLVNLAAFHVMGSLSGDLLDGEPSLEADERTVTLPHFDFDDFGETVTVTIDAGAVSDGVGNLNEAYSWTFTTYPYLFTISGNAGVEGAVLGYGEGLSETAGLDGVYSIVVENGWSGTVTPVLEGYVFDPTSRSYTEVSADQTDQNYTATLLTFTISGNAGLAGVELKDGADELLTTTNAAGDYSFTVDYGWSGTVTPVLEGYVFDPTSRSYTDVTEDLVNQDYTATLLTFTISGNAGLAEVELKDGADEFLAKTNAAGDYSFTVDYGWSGVVTPVLEGYVFIPTSRSYTVVTADQVNQNYTPALEIFTISGNAGVAEAVLQYSILPGEPMEVTADGDGNYVIEVPYGWSGTVTPVLEGYVFDPAFREYTDVTEDQVNQDYEATVVETDYLIFLPLFVN